MLACTKTKIIVFSLLSGGSAGTFGVYKYSEVTIESELRGQVLETEDNKIAETWTVLKTKLGSSTEDLSPDLKEAKNENGHSNKKLRSWCASNYSQIYKNILWTNEKLLQEVKTYCSYTYGDQIKEDERINKEENDTEVSKKITNLKTTTVTNKILIRIKTKAGSDESQSKAELKKFCEQKYKEQITEGEKEEITNWCSKTKTNGGNS